MCIRDRLNQHFKKKPLSFWKEKFDDHKITYGHISTIDEVIEDKQMQANNTFLEFIDRPGKKVVNSPFEISGYEKIPPKLPPELGANTFEVLADLGYTKAETNDFEVDGIISLKHTS